MVQEQRQVTGAIAQRRDVEADAVEAVEQVLAKKALRDAPSQIAVGPRHEPDVDLHGGCVPRGSTAPSCRTRKSLACAASGISAISSRKIVPPCAAWKRPSRFLTAPVKAPFSWPKSSASSRASGKAAQLTATKGPPLRALFGVNPTRDELLAGSGLARHEDGSVAVSHGREAIEETNHRG